MPADVCYDVSRPWAATSSSAFASPRGNFPTITISGPALNAMPRRSSGLWPIPASTTSTPPNIGHWHQHSPLAKSLALLAKEHSELWVIANGHLDERRNAEAIVAPRCRRRRRSRRTGAGQPQLAPSGAGRPSAGARRACRSFRARRQPQRLGVGRRPGRRTAWPAATLTQLAGYSANDVAGPVPDAVARTRDTTISTARISSMATNHTVSGQPPAP